jgi:hypothetical protein
MSAPYSVRVCFRQYLFSYLFSGGSISVSVSEKNIKTNIALLSSIRFRSVFIRTINPPNSCAFTWRTHPADADRAHRRRCIRPQSPWARPIGRTDGINHGTTSLSGSRAARTHGITASSGMARALANFSPELSPGSLSVRKLVERAKIMLDCRAMPSSDQSIFRSQHCNNSLWLEAEHMTKQARPTGTVAILDQGNPLC